ncbi:MAG: DJ-1/PfpI family protein [bacterium]|nr:DJ-1/PfpI family protein [bacterium]
MPRNVAIMIFNEVEVLDFAGPFEVFGVARAISDTTQPLFNVYTIAERAEPIIARNGLSVNPHYTLDNCPKPDIYLIPGGRGTRTAMHNTTLTNWISTNAPRVEQVLSVCTGALMLGKAGLLHGLSATTYHTSFEELAAVSPTTNLMRQSRWVDNGKIVTSAGVSAGIDMALYVVGKLYGVEQARWTARYMEYNWNENPNLA